MEHPVMEAQVTVLADLNGEISTVPVIREEYHVTLTMCGTDTTVTPRIMFNVQSTHNGMAILAPPLKSIALQEVHIMVMGVIQHKPTVQREPIGMEQIAILRMLLVLLALNGMETLVSSWALQFSNVILASIGMDFVAFRKDLIFFPAKQGIILTVLPVFILPLKPQSQLVLLDGTFILNLLVVFSFLKAH